MLHLVILFIEENIMFPWSSIWSFDFRLLALHVRVFFSKLWMCREMVFWGSVVFSLDVHGSRYCSVLSSQWTHEHSRFSWVPLRACRLLHSEWSWVSSICLTVDWWNWSLMARDGSATFYSSSSEICEERRLIDIDSLNAFFKWTPKPRGSLTFATHRCVKLHRFPQPTNEQVII